MFLLLKTTATDGSLESLTAIVKNISDAVPLTVSVVSGASANPPATFLDDDVAKPNFGSFLITEADGSPLLIDGSTPVVTSTSGTYSNPGSSMSLNSYASRSAFIYPPPVANSAVLLRHVTIAVVEGGVLDIMTSSNTVSLKVEPGVYILIPGVNEPRLDPPIAASLTIPLNTTYSFGALGYTAATTFVEPPATDYDEQTPAASSDLRFTPVPLGILGEQVCKQIGCTDQSEIVDVLAALARIDGSEPLQECCERCGEFTQVFGVGLRSDKIQPAGYVPPVDPPATLFVGPNIHHVFKI